MYRVHVDKNTKEKERAIYNMLPSILCSSMS